MTPLGTTSDPQANEFILGHAMSRLGSLTNNGFRRVVTDATGEDLLLQQQDFLGIASSVPVADDVVLLQVANVPACSHRGSQRHTCCGSPNLWICRHHKVDCVATLKDKQTLLSMVNTTEASSLLTCDTCKDRLDPNEQIIQEAMPDSTNPVAHAD